MASSIKIEAENFLFGWGFGSSHGHSFASGGGVLYLTPNKIGGAGTYFNGPSGKYTVKVHYFDENDGVSKVMLDIGGESSYFNMDAALGGSLPSAATATSRTTHQAVQIDKGEAITLFAQALGNEYAAIDYIEFIPVEEPAAPAPAPTTPTPAPAQPSTPAPAPSAPAPAPVGDTPDAHDSFEQQVLELTNAKRAQAGLSPLVFDKKLAAAADRHSQDMAEKNYFSHTQPDGDRLADRVKDEGYKYMRVGENIAAGYKTPEAVVEGWMNSSGHRANILNPNFKELGVGYYKDPDAADTYDHYWTQVFGTEQEIA